MIWETRRLCIFGQDVDDRHSPPIKEAIHTRVQNLNIGNDGEFSFFQNFMLILGLLPSIL